MKLLAKLNLLSPGINLVAIGSVLAVGVVAVNRIVYRLEERVLSRELAGATSRILHSMRQSGLAAAIQTAEDFQHTLQNEPGSKTARLQIIKSPGNRVIYDPDLPANSIAPGNRLKGPIHNSNGSLEYALGGVCYHGLFTAIPSLEWTVGIAIPKREIVAGGAEFLRISGAVAVLGIGLGALATNVFGRTLAKRMAVTHDCVAKLGSGNLSARIASTNIDDELGALQKGINEMGAKIQCRAEERQSTEENLRGRNAALERQLAHRTAQLDAANKELADFSYSVSHDLRTPLRSLDGFSRVLLEDYGDKLDEEGRDSLHRICAASQRMGQIMDDILHLSRITRTKLNRQQVDLSALARAVVDDLQKAEQQRKVDFVIHPNLSANVDLKLMRTVLENLLGNAWKFTIKQPAARIEFGLTSREGNPTYFVSDNGIGFDMAYAHKIFGAFQRLHSAHEFPSTGIGLAAVQRIIHRHGGEVWAQSEPGHGAIFYFTVS